VFEAVLIRLEEEFEDTARRVTSPRASAWDNLVAGCHAFLVTCMRPDLQRIVLLDGPAVLGHERWREIEACHALAPLLAGLTRAISDGVVPPHPPAPLAQVLLAAINEAGLLIAEAPDRSWPGARPEKRSTRSSRLTSATYVDEAPLRSVGVTSPPPRASKPPPRQSPAMTPRSSANQASASSVLRRRYSPAAAWGRMRKARDADAAVPIGDGQRLAERHRCVLGYRVWRVADARRRALRCRNPRHRPGATPDELSGAGSAYEPDGRTLNRATLMRRNGVRPRGTSESLTLGITILSCHRSRAGVAWRREPIGLSGGQAPAPSDPFAPLLHGPTVVRIPARAVEHSDR
jgi:hypothetical protein